tara:strand:+ start:109 stop:321 length:213 start_codon:yes stop_codon:yes gene_type:complete
MDLRKPEDGYVPPRTSLEPMLTVKDVAFHLRVSNDQVYKLRQQGKIHFKPNNAGKIVCYESELKRFIDEG